MDFVNLIIKREKNSKTCFLCFKNDKNSVDIFQNQSIQEENKTTNLSLFNMIKFLFPSQDMLFYQACSTCIKLITDMYITLKRHKTNIRILTTILNKLSKDVEEELLLSTEESCYIHINTFEDNKSFKNSINTTLINSENNFVCENNSKVTLKQYKTHLNDANICHICGKQFKSLHTLKSHLNCHKKKCPYCIKDLKAHSHYSLHLKSHEKKIKRVRKKNYNCNDCSYSSIDKASLEAHINKIHLHKRPYMCDVCFKAFYKKKTLVEHLSIHEMMKKVTCEICGESFLHKKTLFEHLRLHSGDKPYQCEFCNAKFVTSGRRLDHMKRKHYEKTELCLICNKKYSMRSELKRHVEKVHGTTNVLNN